MKEKIKCSIILRTCSEVYALHQSAEIKSLPRILGSEISKQEIILRSLNSLVKAINNCNEELSLTIIDDHSSSECLEEMEKILENCSVKVETFSLDETGNGASLGGVLDYGKEVGDGLLFFVEDDYVYNQNCLVEMFDTYRIFKEKLASEIALAPCDNMDNYITDYRNVPCNIGIGSNRHWRTVTNSTCTFMCSSALLEKYWFIFDKLRLWGDSNISESTTINSIWTAPFRNAGGAFLLNPIPSLAIHLAYKDQIPPFVEWEKWWEEANWRK
jgi:hypothetical protein